MHDIHRSIVDFTTLAMTISLLLSRAAAATGLAAFIVGLAAQAAPVEQPKTTSEPGHSLHGEAFDEGPRQQAYLMDGMPKLEFPVTTTNALAQKFFVQGLGQLHGFWYFEAERSFRQVAKLDTNCAMAFWGMTMANVQNEKRAKEFLQIAVKMTNGISRREYLYIDSLGQFYEIGRKEKSTNETDRHRQYVRSLEQIVEEFPDDIEAKAFLVFKIWENGGRIKISSHTAVDALAKEILTASPLHPIHHARIHFWNGEVDRRALNSAARCGEGSPAIAHMWHMPGHTYSSLHRYSDAAWQQEASARVDHAYMIRNQILPDQIHNYAHNNEWLVSNLSYLGRVHEAIDLARNLIELPRHPRHNSLSKPKPAPSSSQEGASTNTPPQRTLTDSSIAANSRRQNSAVQGRRRLFETLVRWELWPSILQMRGTLYLEPTEAPEERAKVIRLLGLASFATGDRSAGARQIEALESLLKEQKNLRQQDVDDAEAKAKKEKLPDDKILKAMNDALQAHMDKIKATEKILSELKLYSALAAKDLDEARKQLEANTDLPKERLAQVHLQLNNPEQAVKVAEEAVKGASNQVQVLANYVEILERSGKTNEAATAFATLRSVAGHSDLDSPILQRLAPIAKRLQFPSDWRLPAEAASDLGQRPPLESLGPFRWHPAQAQPWELADAQGKKVSLSDYRGKPVLVIFYLGYGCRHCLEQLNAFAPAAKKFAKSGINLVAISTDSPDGLQKTFAESNEPFPFPILSNSTLDVFKAYRAFDDFEEMPLHGTFLIDGKGLVRWLDISYEPFTDVDFLHAEAERLLAMPGPSDFAQRTKKAPARSPKGNSVL